MDRSTAKSIMTPIDNVYMLQFNAHLDFETTNEIIAHGFTRIPVYKDDRKNITSVLNVKDLAFVDPKEKLPVSTICNFYNRPFIYVGANTTLRLLFDMFRKGNLTINGVKCSAILSSCFNTKNRAYLILLQFTIYWKTEVEPT